MKKSLWLATVLAATLLAACTNLKEPATQALSQAESSLSSIREAAAQYAPTDLQSVDASLDALKKKLADGDFKAVIADAPALTDAISKLGDTVNAKKAEALAALDKAKEQWTSFSADVPQMLAAIQSRVDVLSKSRKLPANVSKADFDASKSGVEALESGWADAGAAFTGGDVAGAVAKAQAIKDQGLEILKKLGMSAS